MATAKSKLKPAFVLSALIAILLLVATVGGLWWGNLYQDQNELIRKSWLPNDLVTMVVAFPFLVVSLALAKRRSTSFSCSMCLCFRCRSGRLFLGWPTLMPGRSARDFALGPR